jgi:hypothetical protein
MIFLVARITLEFPHSGTDSILQKIANASAKDTVDHLLFHFKINSFMAATVIRGFLLSSKRFKKTLR